METLVFPTQDQLSQHQEYWSKPMGYTPPRRRNTALYRSSSSDLSSAPVPGVASESRPSTAGGRVNPRKTSPAKNGFNSKGNKSAPRPNNSGGNRNKIPNAGGRVLENKDKKGLVKRNGGCQRKDEGSSPPKITILQRPTCPEDAMVGLATITGMSLSEVYSVYEKKGVSPPVDVLKLEVVKQVNQVKRDVPANNVKKVNGDGQAKKTNDVNKVSKSFIDSPKEENKDSGALVNKLRKASSDSPKEGKKGGEVVVNETLVKELKKELYKLKDEHAVKKPVTTTEEPLSTPIRTKVVKAAAEIAEKYEIGTKAVKAAAVIAEKFETTDSLAPVVTPVKEESVLAAKDFFLFEKWAGPAFTNSPPPSSLPLPSFSWRRKEFRVPDVESPQMEMDTEAATRGLRRILNLDF